MTISFTIPIIPKGQMRDRITNAGGFARSYKHKDQTTYEDNVAGLIERYIPDEPLQGPLRLTVYIYMAIPKSKPKWWKDAALRGLILPESTPDCDNILKNIADIMGQTNFYDDDRQIYRAVIQKMYSTKPRWHICLVQMYSIKSKKEYDAILEGQSHE